MLHSFISRLALSLSLLFLSLVPAANAALRLPRLISDGMVLQRNRPLTVWGWADATQPVTVSLLKEGKASKPLCTASATADAQGYWSLTLPSQKAGGPFRLRITAGDAAEVQEISDVWVGDVWLFSGQSNIDTNLERVHPQYPDEIDNDSTSRVRLFKVENTAELHAPRNDVRSSGWQYLSRRSGWRFTALGYFMGKRMLQQTGVVQGIVQSSWGGTPIESWLPVNEVQRFAPLMVTEARLHDDAEYRQQTAAANMRASQRWNQLLEELDPGITEGWTAADLDDSGWQPTNQYHLTAQPRRGFCGTYWLRQHIHIDAAHAGKDARLLLGTLVDADFTYLNGQQIGSTGYQYPPRRYTLPGHLLREGDNVLTVRFVNRGLYPKFIQQKPYQIIFADGTVQPLSEEWLVHDGVQMPSQPGLPSNYQNMASAAYNGMLSPLAPYTFAGAVWYQGESNTDRPVLYEQELTTLISTWRQLFRQPLLPFVIVQLANFMEPSAQPQESSWARLRESQRRAVAATPNARLAVALGLGEANDIHPLRKKELAERCALAFDALVFGKKVTLSPQPLSATQTTGNHVLITFDTPLAEGHVSGFEVSAGSQPFQNIEATAQGNTVELTLPSSILHLASSLRIRYAWKDNPVDADLRSSANALPATSFEMDVAVQP